MINKKFFNEQKKKYLAVGLAKRSLGEISNQAQHLSKQAIFAAQRGEDTARLLKQAANWLKRGVRLFLKAEDLEHQDNYRAALEEFTEATLLTQVINNQPVGPIDGFNVPTEVYLGAVSDLVGEMVRLAIRYATAGDKFKVEALYQLAEELVKWLAEFNMTGSLRSKFDQAKRHLMRLEEIQYDLSLNKHV